MATLNRLAAGAPVVGNVTATHVPPRRAPGDLAHIAAGQHGLFTRTQARTCGYSGYEFRRRLLDGRWVHVLGPVYTVAKAIVTQQLLDRAVTLAVPGAVLAGLSAARLHTMPVTATGQYVVLPRHNARAPAGVRRWRDSPPDSDVSHVDGVAVTSPPRTIFDCVRVLPDPQAIDLLDLALRRQWTTWRDFTTRIQAHAGRHGHPRLAALAGITEVSTDRTAALMSPSGARRWSGLCDVCGRGSTIRGA